MAIVKTYWLINYLKETASRVGLKLGPRTCRSELWLGRLPVTVCGRVRDRSNPRSIPHSAPAVVRRMACLLGCPTPFSPSTRPGKFAAPPWKPPVSGSARFFRRFGFRAGASNPARPGTPFVSRMVFRLDTPNLRTGECKGKRAPRMWSTMFWTSEWGFRCAFFPLLPRKHGCPALQGQEGPPRRSLGVIALVFVGLQVWRRWVLSVHCPGCSKICRNSRPKFGSLLM